MVVGVPNWDIFKGPKQITKSKRKPQPVEQEIVEEGSKEQSGDKDDAADVTDQVDSGTERLATEENEGVTDEQVTKIAQRKAVQKERRSKKRNERPEDAEENQPSRALKRKKTVVSKGKIDEEVLVFPSDVDAEIRQMEYLFSQSLRILGNHLKSKIQGRGMTAVRDLFDIAERSRAPRLTFYNHEKELERLATLDVEFKKLSRNACEATARLAREEATYENMVLATEQAWIAAAAEQVLKAAERVVGEEACYASLMNDADQARMAEFEHKRLADQEALKLMVDMAVHIAEVETNKIKENLASEEDFVMLDQNLSGEDSDKGKKPIVDSSPPRYPPRLVQGSSSSAIPSAIQLALDEIKSDLREELRNEMDEFRADIREDMNRSGEATNKKIDAMMELLLKLTQQQPKP
ncbi:hypothetical protein QL285_087239 [Trifolium repens]|nr:hypothetical protein QL285_087239 [Trifolium repens]